MPLLANKRLLLLARSFPRQRPLGTSNGYKLTARCFSGMIQHTNASVRGNFGSYGEEYESSIHSPEKFWMEKAKDIFWFKPPTVALERDISNPHMNRWFPDGELNMSYNCLDVHCKSGRADQVAIYYDSPVTGGTKQALTYQQLLDRVSTLAAALKELGVEKGDRVIIYMPMIPEAIVSMLACTRIGAIHSVVFGGFAAKELATRITDCDPKVIVSASAGVEPSRTVPYKPLLDKALELADAPSLKHTIIKQRPNVDATADLVHPRDVDYDELMSTTSSKADAIPLPSNHSHYILYTSGTMGTPKGIVRDTAGMAVALKYSMSSFYDLSPGDVMFTASDIGWVVGHSYIVYAPLLHGVSTVLYEGKPVGTPDAGALWRVMQDYQVRTFFVAPTAFRAIKQADPKAELAQNYDLSSLNVVFLAGEHSDPYTIHYCEQALKNCDVAVRTPIDHWWQTELGHPGTGNALGLGRMPVKPGACAAAVPGYAIHILDDEGKELPRGELGNMVIRTPLPPGTLQTLYNNDERYVDDYLTKFPGYYDTGDAAHMDEDGYIYIMGRTDDLINTAGHRLSTGAIEELLQSHPEVAECAVIPVKDTIKGEIPVGFVILNKGSTKDEAELKEELIQIVRDELGPVASFKKCGVVKALPKTRSGKILRSTMSKIANGQVYSVTPTIDDPEIFNYLEPIIQGVVSQ